MQVYKALLDGEREVAVKMLSSVDEWQLQQFRHEINLLRSLPVNSNVVQVGCCFDVKGFLPAPKLHSAGTCTFCRRSILQHTDQLPAFAEQRW